MQNFNECCFFNSGRKVIEDIKYHYFKVEIMESKIVIVIVVIAVIFTGMVIWLFKLDRKVSKLEKEQQKNIND